MGSFPYDGKTMAQCPVCGEENPPSASNCRSCQLAVSLFEPVREAAGSSSDDTDYARTIAEILAVVGTEPELGEPSGAPAGSTAMLTTQARFPALTSPSAPAPVERSPLLAPALPTLPAGSGLSVARQQIEELLQVGRREGLDLQDADARMLSALKAEDRAALDEIRRLLFVQVSAAVAEDFETQMARRNELSPLVATPAIDSGLAESRTSFTAGDLAGAVRRLRQVSDGLSSLEEEWATCQILTTEADLMSETLRELGEDPGPALGPLGEARRLARAGDSARAETVLAGANRALWGLLVPQLNRSLQAIRVQLRDRPTSEEEIEPVVRELRQLAALIRRKNFGAAVASYRRLRAAASALSVPVQS